MLGSPGGVGLALAMRCIEVLGNLYIEDLGQETCQKTYAGTLFMRRRDFWKKASSWSFWRTLSVKLHSC